MGGPAGALHWGRADRLVPGRPPLRPALRRHPLHLRPGHLRRQAHLEQAPAPLRRRHGPGGAVPHSSARTENNSGLHPLSSLASGVNTIIKSITILSIVNVHITGVLRDLFLLISGVVGQLAGGGCCLLTTRLRLIVSYDCLDKQLLGKLSRHIVIFINYSEKLDIYKNIYVYL